MMRSYRHLDSFLDFLMEDIYPQPMDDGHNRMTQEVIDLWVKDLGVKTVLDVGCGQGNAYWPFKNLGIKWQGLTLGETDFKVCLDKQLPVVQEDMTFTSFEQDSFDLVFARHVLEHSPMPLISLMEWQRLSKAYCIVVLPSVNTQVMGGRNHYYMLTPEQWTILFRNAGWAIEDFNGDCVDEYRYLLKD